jgi:hypothetical protein
MAKNKQTKTQQAASDVRKFLQEMEYPVTREDIMSFLNKNAAGTMFVEGLAKLPHEIFYDFRQVTKSLRGV